MIHVHVTSAKKYGNEQQMVGISTYSTKAAFLKDVGKAFDLVKSDDQLIISIQVRNVK